MTVWWENWTDFLAMGRHGTYVWGSIGMTAILVLIEIIQARVARRESIHQVRQSIELLETERTFTSS
jgi:heme exporter protein D